MNGNTTFTFAIVGELSRGDPAACNKVAAARKIQAFYRKYEIHQRLKSGLKHPGL